MAKTATKTGATSATKPIVEKATTFMPKRAERKGKAENEYAKKIARAVELQEAIKAQGEELSEIKEYFADIFANSEKLTNSIVTEKGTATVKESSSYSVDTEAIADLKKAFKKTFPEYVSEKISYGVTAKFKKLLADANHKLGVTLRESVTIKTSKSIQFQGIK